MSVESKTFVVELSPWGKLYGSIVYGPIPASVKPVYKCVLSPIDTSDIATLMGRYLVGRITHDFKK